MENKSIGEVNQSGQVKGIKAGISLVIATSKKDNRKGIYMLVVTDPKIIQQNKNSKKNIYHNKGILLFPADVDSVPEWPRMAKEAGLNTIGLHPGGGHLHGITKGLENWVEGSKGKTFLANCRKHGIEVEYEIHAVKELLPRALFSKDPSMFRSVGGKRVQADNLCVHSHDALKELSKNVVRLSKAAKPTTGRYYYSPDDGRGMCRCFACKEYSDSEQCLMMELYLQKELEKIDPKATVSHLCYANTLSPPVKIKPNNKIFLEFAPIARSYDKSYSVQENSKQGWAHLKANLKLFSPETAQVLEYWVDVSKWSNWKRPFKPLPWDNMLGKVINDDVRFYQSMGIVHFTSFGNGLDGYYKENYGFGNTIKEYGQAFHQKEQE